MYYVYLLTNYTNKVLYTGVTNNLPRRLYEHKHHFVDGFTSRYHVTKLVYYEETEDIYAAIEREHQIKGWTRAKKDALIEIKNPQWKDISMEWEEHSFPIPRREGIANEQEATV